MNIPLKQFQLKFSGLRWTYWLHDRQLLEIGRLHSSRKIFRRVDKHRVQTGNRNLALGTCRSGMTFKLKQPVVQVWPSSLNNLSFRYNHFPSILSKWRSEYQPSNNGVLVFHSGFIWKSRDIYRRLSICSHDNLSLVILNNKTLEHWRLVVKFIAMLWWI